MTEIDPEPGTLETDRIEVRALQPSDLDWVIRIDQERTGRARSEYYRVKFHEAESDTGVRISLAATIDSDPAGFLMGRLYYGEFGLPEAVAVLDSIGVVRAHGGKQVGRALMRQLSMNLAALRIEKVQTQVEWDDAELIGFFRHFGFRPASRLCLEMSVEPPNE